MITEQLVAVLKAVDAIINSLDPVLVGNLVTAVSALSV